VVLGRVTGVQGLPQVTGNPLYTNALGAAKALARTLNSEHKPARSGGFFDKLKNLL